MRSDNINFEESKKRIKSIVENKERAITLIVLVITIIIMLTLAGITISATTNNNSILTKTKKAAIISDFSKYNEEVEIFKEEKMIENENFHVESLTAGKNTLTYNTQTQEDIKKEVNIKTIIPDLKDQYLENFEIIKGEILFKSQDQSLLKIAQEIGISINPYNIENGELKSSNTNLMLMDSQGNLTLPETVTSIASGTFSNISGLKKVIIPYTCKEIKSDAFSFCNDLSSVIFETKVNEDGINEGCQKIGSGAFRSCGISKVDLPDCLNEISDACFMSCLISEIDIPENIETIPSNSFALCKNLNKVNFLGDKVIKIEYDAFLGTKLSKIRITQNVSEIDSSAFENCDYLQTINIDKNNSKFKYSNGMLINTDDSTNEEKVVFVSKKYYEGVTEMEIPAGTTEFTANINNIKVTKIKIPSTVKKLNYGDSFPDTISDVVIDSENSNYVTQENCIYTKDLTKLVLCYSKEKNIVLKNENATEILSRAFNCATNASYIKLQDSITTLKNSIVARENVKTFEIGSKVKNISLTFWNKFDDFNLVVNKNNPYFMVENRILYSKDKTKIYNVFYKITGEFILDEKVKTICQGCFCSQGEMTKFVPNNILEKIEQQAFVWSSITTIELPSSIKEIDSNAFAGTPKLKNMYIDKSKNSIQGAPWGANAGEKILHWKE